MKNNGKNFTIITPKNVREVRTASQKQPLIMLEFSRESGWHSDEKVDGYVPHATDAAFRLIGDGRIKNDKGDDFRWHLDTNTLASQHPLSRNFLLCRHSPPRSEEECAKIDARNNPLNLLTAVSTYEWQHLSSMFPKLITANQKYQVEISQHNGVRGGMLYPPHQGTLWIHAEDGIQNALFFAFTYMAHMINLTNATDAYSYRNLSEVPCISQEDVVSILDYIMKDLQTGEVVKESIRVGKFADACTGLG